MVFFITAHEIAHQWFGMQVEGANVQGRNFILESMAQYAALMVFKSYYPEEKVQQIIELHKEMYEKGRKESSKEPSLALVENEDYVYYDKGLLAMYKLQELIGEDKLNKALRHFIVDWHSFHGKKKVNTKRYARSSDLLAYFKEESPEACHDAIHQWFETTNELDWD